MKATIEALVKSAREWYVKTKNTHEDHIVADENLINAKYSYDELSTAAKQGYLAHPAGSDRFYIRLA